MEPSFAFDPEFFSSLNGLAPADMQRAMTALEKYQKRPDSTGLNLKQLKGKAGRNRLWTIRASQELRVLLAREGSTSVFLRAGHHEKLYDLADRLTFVAPVVGKPGLMPVRSGAMERRGSGTVPRPVAPRVADEGPSILEHWSSAELLEAGFDRDEISRLRRATQETLLEVWPDIGEEKFELVMECLEQSPEDRRQRRLIPDDEGRDERFREAIAERGAAAGLSSLLTANEFERLISAPIEDWMIFLHPDQRSLVERRFSGPARVRGSAGTGKTAVALHRAAALAKRLSRDLPHNGGNRRSSPILYTTFVKSLPPIFENLYRRLPGSAHGAVEFVNVDRLAHRICHEEGHRPSLNPRLAEQAWEAAFTAVVRAGTPLDRAGLTRRYLRDEVTAVLKGCGVDTLEQYLGLERTGRRTPFTAPMREQAWALREDWDRRLSEAGIIDFPDVIRRARDLARRRPQPAYRAAIIDESQDLTLVGLQLIRALVNGEAGADRPDGLFIVGDGAQKIYPGGFTLAQAGVDVRGNSFVLRVNYRNTREIIDAALACTGAEPVDDLGDRYARGDAAAEARPCGVKPSLVQAGDIGDQIAYVAEQVRRLCEGPDLGPGDIGAFMATNSLVQRTIGGLEASGIECQTLDRFDGRPNRCVKVGTFHRAKGLEFKIVFLLGLSEGAFPIRQRSGQSRSEYEEQRAIQASELFVAMTRARDRLFVLCDHPSDTLLKGLDYLDEEVARGR